jgi:hypothetical protein
MDELEARERAIKEYELHKQEQAALEAKLAEVDSCQLECDS